MLDTHTDMHVSLNKEPVDCKKIAADSNFRNPQVAFKLSIKNLPVLKKKTTVKLEAVQACSQIMAATFLQWNRMMHTVLLIAPACSHLDQSFHVSHCCLRLRDGASSRLQGPVDDLLLINKALLPHL